MIAEALNSKCGTNIDRRAVEIQPVRTLGEHKARIRLTMDLVPEIKIIVHREGETVAVPPLQPPLVPKRLKRQKLKR
jgi:large subunit ribosomal protein L9